MLSACMWMSECGGDGDASRWDRSATGVPGTRSNSYTINSTVASTIACVSLEIMYSNVLVTSYEYSSVYQDYEYE